MCIDLSIWGYDVLRYGYGVWDTVTKTVTKRMVSENAQ